MFYVYDGIGELRKLRRFFPTLKKCTKDLNTSLREAKSSKCIQKACWSNTCMVGVAQIKQIPSITSKLKINK